MPKTSRDKAAVVVVSVAMAAVLGILVFRGVTGPIFTNRQPIPMAIPTVNTTLAASDGSQHSIQTDMALRFSKTPRRIDYNGIQNKAVDIISGLDYDRITGRDGVDYLKENLKAGLNGYLESAAVDDVYITDIQTDERAFAPKTSGGAAEKRTQFLQG